MLAEFFEAFLEKLGDNNRDRVRVIKMKDGIPGELAILNRNAEGVYEADTVTVPLKPPTFVARTLKAFLETIVTAVKFQKKKDTQIYIGDSNIIAFLSDEMKDVFEECDQVRMKLDQTAGFKFACSSVGSSASTLKFKILELFTGMPSEGPHPILKLVPMLSKVSVNESKKTQTTNDKASASLGIDVQQSLALNNEDMPEIVDVPVRVYDQIDYVCQVKMLFRYDFERGQFVLTPVRRSIDEAIDSTVTFMSELIDRIELDKNTFAVFPAEIVLPSGVPELD